MTKLLQRLPRNVGLWVPVLMLPLVVGELWLHARGARPNPGVALSLGALMAMLGWYLLGGSIAIGMALGWYAFSTHYYNEGVASCQAGRATDTNAANVAQNRARL